MAMRIYGTLTEFSCLTRENGNNYNTKIENIYVQNLIMALFGNQLLVVS